MNEERLRLRQVVAAWWPLWASWALMGAEQPLTASVLARLPDPEIGLAAHGSVVFPVALVIEAPIIMLLSASTELTRDRASHRALSGFTHRAGAVLTLIHLLVAVTPLFDLVVRGLLSVPEEVADQARWGMILLLPWPWAIAWRRQGQGVLIRYGRSRVVGIATAGRLVVTTACLAIGWVLRAPGAPVAAVALSSGVLFEALVVAIAVRPVVRRYLSEDDPGTTVLRGAAFWSFYIPLAMTPMVALVIQPVGTAAVSRMPQVVESLAVWPVVAGFVFLLQSPGMAFAEVVVALLGRPHGVATLRRFTWILASIALAVPLAFAATPLADLWFRQVTGIRDELVALARVSLWVSVPIPACRVVQSWHQGRLVAARKTRAVSEAVAVFAVVCVAVLVTGVGWQGVPGVWFASGGYTLGRLAQAGWIAWRASSLRDPP